MNRRLFLTRAAQLGAVAAGGALLAACSSGDDDTSAAASGSGAGLGTLNYQLSWLFISEWSGQYLADQNGYWADEGFSSVALKPGGSNAGAPETAITQGNAFAAVSVFDLTAPAILQGAPVKCIGVMYQRSPSCIMSMAEAPINDPQGLVGKTIGVSAGNLGTYQAFLAANDIPEDAVTRVPVENDPLPLTTGTVDAWFGYYYNEPSLLEVQGYQTTAFLLSDFGYPLSGNPIIVAQDSIDNDREKVKAFLRGDIRGQLANIADPRRGAELTTGTYGKDLGLDTAEQETENRASIELIQSADTTANGLYTMTDELVQANLETLAAGGNKLAADELFDLSLLQEVYDEDPSLRGA
jgi:ABC-type nitrate/sulfonate/bicarbonate transport system substrate-binding protein